MNPIEVWYAIPSASARNAARTLPAWRERGYRVAVVQDQDRRFECPADIVVAPFERYPGYGACINHLIHHVVPASAAIIVSGGDDMLPDLRFTAQELAEEFLGRFPDTFGVMQPVGDDYGNTRNICGSPWIGREFARRAYGGAGPYCRAYFQLYEDQELHDAAERLGVLWKRPDLSHYHQHWERAGAGAKPPEYLRESLARESQSRAIYTARRGAGFPGHEPLPASARAMKLVALMPARNEEWCIGLSLSVALMYCDEVVVFDHGSTDGTATIIADVAARHSGRVHVIADGTEGWSEVHIRSVLHAEARRRGATHIALIDADEAISASALHLARDLYRASCRPGFAPRLPMISPWDGLSVHRTDERFRLRLYSGFLDQPRLEYRPAGDGYQMHGRIPTGLSDLEWDIEGGVFHLQFASRHRLRVKAVWYKLQELLRWRRYEDAQELNRVYDWALAAPAAVSPIPASWWAPYADLAARYLNLDAPLWQEAEIKQLVARHGAERFRGIDFHGLIEGAEPEAPAAGARERPGATGAARLRAARVRAS